MSNIDPQTVSSFGDEWLRFDQSRMSIIEAREVGHRERGDRRDRSMDGIGRSKPCSAAFEWSPEADSKRRALAEEKRSAALDAYARVYKEIVLEPVGWRRDKGPIG
jgi:hypothetical protein